MSCARCRQPKDHPFHAPKGLFGRGLETHEYVEGGAAAAAKVAPPAQDAEKPKCPKCGKTEGYLGTSNAYFVCIDCREQYWTADHLHPGDWAVAILASPYGRKSEVLAMLNAERAKLKDTETLLAAQATRLRELEAEREEVWKGLYQSYELEPREVIERESKTNGFKYPLVQAIHTIWKREPKVQEAAEAARPAPEARLPLTTKE